MVCRWVLVLKTPLFWMALVKNRRGLEKVGLFSSFRAARRWLKGKKTGPGQKIFFKKLSRLIRLVFETGRTSSLWAVLDLTNLTNFQKKILQLTSRIPLGQTRTYRQLADLAGRPRGARAVGQVLKMNPWPFLIPCHRVVGQNSLGGYKGGLKLKRKLLKSEKMFTIDRRNFFSK